MFVKSAVKSPYYGRPNVSKFAKLKFVVAILNSLSLDSNSLSLKLNSLPLT